MGVGAEVCPLDVTGDDTSSLQLPGIGSPEVDMPFLVYAMGDGADGESSGSERIDHFVSHLKSIRADTGADDTLYVFGAGAESVEHST